MSGGLCGGQTMMTRVVAFGLVATLAAPLGAQQMMNVSQAQENALKSNVTLFELALRQSIIRAGQQLGAWAGQIAPGVMMAFAEPPTVRSVPLIDNSLVFHVEVSEILPTAVNLFDQYQKMQPPNPPPNPAPRVSNPGAPPPPEMVASSKSPDSMPRMAMSPDQYYTTLVHDGLVEAMLENSHSLPLKDGQTLTVACTPVEVSQRGLRSPSRQLVLQIKGEDLLAYHSGKIDKDEARRRIIERRF